MAEEREEEPVVPADPPARKRAPMASAPDVLPPLFAGATEDAPFAADEFFLLDDAAAVGL